MMTKNEKLIIKALADFADTNCINKSDIARSLDVSRTTVRNVINKLKKGVYSVGK